MGKIVRISGPVVEAEDVEDAKMYDVVKVGNMGLIGEIIKIEGNKSTIQVYEDTAGIRPEEAVENTKQPLSVELGPGLLKSIYDGIQRPLDVIRETSGNFIARGLNPFPLDRKKLWDFVPAVKVGDDVSPGQILGTVQETSLITHKIMVPAGVSGKVYSISGGKHVIDDVVAIITTNRGKLEVKMMTRWPVRIARSVIKKLPPDLPLVTGQRVIDMLFPVAKGGTAAVPGPFGSGKCVSGDTPILLADGSVVSISELYDRMRKDPESEVKREGFEEIIRLGKPLGIYSLYNGRIGKSSTEILYRGKSNQMLRIRTESGREVTVTPVHKLFKVVSDGINEVMAKDLKKNDYISSVRRYDGVDEIANHKELYRIWPFTAVHNGSYAFRAPDRYKQAEISYRLSANNINHTLESANGNYMVYLANDPENESENLLVQANQNSDLTLEDAASLERTDKEDESVFSYIFPDRIVSIESIYGTFDVYDLSVPDYGLNFVGGYGGILLHNTVIQHQLAKWSDASIVVYIGCGERGNEMTEILTTFPELKDPKSGQPLMDRTVLIANTSNMPVAAREASIYTGITIAEYYRDMGYDVALMADSTSRWAEALREISGRLEEMPGEEGYPAYLGRRISEFYERSGRARLISPDDRYGSITVIGAVSPPGGDISEPVSQNTLRVTRVFWALDASLANRRHFPSINWLNSYSLYTEDLKKWYDANVNAEWNKLREDAMGLLQRESELQEVAQLVGYDAMPEKEKSILDVARMIREDFLQQSAFDDIDSYCSLEKQYMMMKSIMELNRYQNMVLDRGLSMDNVENLTVREKISRMKIVPESDIKSYYEATINDIHNEYGMLVGEKNAETSI
ncbi:MAG: V-type ATP synthase subunit A [Thermoplasmata archaeon]